MSTTIGYDAEGANAATMPPGQHMGYVTGSAGVPWSPEQYVADPLAGRIDQSPDNTQQDETADVLDFESGAATLADIVPWVTSARANFNNAVRPGQRWPMIYCDRSNLTPVCNQLVSGHLTDVPIWLAAYGLTVAQAVAMIEGASGPFPIKGVQNSSNSTYDTDVFDAGWLVTMSGKAGDTVQAGNGGPAVQAAQHLLNEWQPKVGKYALLTVDGAFGQLTRQAVTDFQAYKALAQDGVVGPKTWAELDAIPVPQPPLAPLTLSAVAATSALIKVSRAIPGYTNAYHTAVYDAAGKELANVVNDLGDITVAVPSTGVYKVVSGANGYTDDTKTVTVP